MQRIQSSHDQDKEAVVDAANERNHTGTNTFQNPISVLDIDVTIPIVPLKVAKNVKVASISAKSACRFSPHYVLHERPP